MAAENLAGLPHEVNPVLLGFLRLEAKEANGDRVFANRPTVERIFAGTEGPMLGERHTVFDVITSDHHGAPEPEFRALCDG